LRAEQLSKKEKPRYDGCCREKNLPETNEPYVIRFKTPSEGEVTFHDEVNGTITIQNSELDDLVLIKSDGYPTYNFAVVVDDLDMEITHVIRGTDHINNTPRQINIFHALGAKIPVFAHVPMILGSDGSKLSKRHGAVNVMQYRDDGFLREAFINYLIRLGWSHGDQEVFSREEIINLFDIKDVNKAAAAFNAEKLLWLNRHYLKTLDPEVVVQQLLWQINDLKIDVNSGPPLVEIVKALRDRSETLRELAVKARVFYEDFSAYEESGRKYLNSSILEFMRAAYHRFEVLGDWTREYLHQIIEDITKQFGLKMGQVAQPIRVAVTGGTVSPPLDLTLHLLGREKVLGRLDKAIIFAETVANNQLNSL
jgi:glutamyl-tRNA synthetase